MDYMISPVLPNNEIQNQKRNRSHPKIPGTRLQQKSKSGKGKENNETFQIAEYLDQFQCAIFGRKKHFWKEKKSARKNVYLFLTLKMEMKKYLLNKVLRMTALA